jgi:DNA-binding NarL/FixJ family response regulator
MSARSDIIGVVERAYTLEGSDQEWLQGLVDAAHPLLEKGRGTWGCLLAVTPAVSLDLRASAFRNMGAAQSQDIPKLMLSAPPQVVGANYRPFTVLSGTASEFGRGFVLSEHPGWRSLAHPHRFCDARSVAAMNDGYGCQISSCLPATEGSTPKWKHVWNRVATHMAAGLRLRRELAQASVLDGAEAVLSPTGRFEHAEQAARSSGARERLQRAAHNIERARGRLRRRDSDEAIEIWRGLVAGRWSLVDHFERSGRRYLVALKNDPAVRDPRALGMRERQVAWHAALGHSNKLIAYELGLSLSTVATYLARACTKLGVRSRVELIALLRGPGVDAMASED